MVRLKDLSSGRVFSAKLSKVTPSRGFGGGAFIGSTGEVFPFSKFREV